MQSILIILFIIALTIYRNYKNSIKLSNKKINFKKSYQKTVISLGIETVICFLIVFMFKQNSITNILKLNMFRFNLFTYLLLIAICILIFMFTFVNVQFKAPDNIDSSQSIPMTIPNDSQEKTYFYLMHLTSPIFEEIIYRGFLISSLLYIVNNNLVAILLSALLFGLSHYHYGKQGIIMVSLLGFILGVYFVYTNSIILNISIHLIMNMITLYGMKKVESKKNVII